MHNPTHTHYTRSAQNPPHMGVSQIKKICTADFYTLLYRSCNTVLLADHCISIDDLGRSINTCTIQMLKFLLIIQICSIVQQQCSEPVAIYPTHDSHYDCATAGYLHSLNTLHNLGSTTVNDNQVVIKLSCEPQHST